MPISFSFGHSARRRSRFDPTGRENKRRLLVPTKQILPILISPFAAAIHRRWSSPSVSTSLKRASALPQSSSCTGTRGGSQAPTHPGLATPPARACVVRTLHRPATVPLPIGRRPFKVRAGSCSYWLVWIPSFRGGLPFVSRSTPNSSISCGICVLLGGPP